jgi:type VI secretion system protein ImpL
VGETDTVDAIAAPLNTLGNLLSGPWAWLPGVVLLLLALVALVFLLRRAPGWLRRGPHRLGAWSRQLLRALRYLSTRREWRYTMPWTLLVGDVGSGKSSVVASVKGGRRSHLLIKEAHLAVPDSEWAFFDNGVVIDIRDLPDADAETTDRHWRAVLDDIDAQRPERPLDSVVLTISAADLLSPSAGALQTLAERSYKRLFDLQKRFSFTFPVYVLVTQCDRVEGFNAFWEPHAEARRGELFGWSSPFSLRHRFDADWVDASFMQVREELHIAQLDAAAHHHIDNPDAFFLFPQRFSALRQPLRTVLGLIFQSAAYHEDFLVRGLYFSGRIAAAQRILEDALDANHEPLPVDDVIFVDDLFNGRVFRERNLAYATTHGIWSRNRLLRRVQIGMLAAAALLVVVLALTGMRLNEQVDATVVSINATRQPEQALETGGRCQLGSVDKIYLLLGNLAKMDMDWSYPTIPASWFDTGVVTGVARATADDVLKAIVFPSLRCRLETRAQALVTVPQDAVADPQEPMAAVAAARTQVGDYLNQVRALERALNNYKFITDRSVGDSRDLGKETLDRFSALAEYAYGEPLPAAVRHGQRMRALSYLHDLAQPHLPEEFHKRVRKRLGERLAHARNVIRARLNDGANLIRQIENDTIGVDGGYFANWLKFVDQDWLSADGNSNPCAQMLNLAKPLIDDLVKNFHYESNLGEGLAQFGSDPEPGDRDGKGCFEASLLTIEAASVPPYGSVTVHVTTADGNSHLQIAPWVHEELAGLEALRDLNFINVPHIHGFACQAPLSGWDGALLAEAAGYAREYQAFREQRKLPSPQRVDSDKKPLYDRLARRRLLAVLDDRVNHAQTPLTLADTAASVWLSPLSTGDERLGSRSRAFAMTAPQLQMVLGLYAQFGMDAQAIQACARGFAAGELNAANRLAEASGLYEPATDPDALGVTADADTPPYFALGSAADSKEYLQQQLQRAQVLAGYTEPFVRFLQGTRQATVSDADSRQGASFWEGTINEIERYVQGKDPKGQVALLHALVQKHLRGMSQANCTQALAAMPETEAGLGIFHSRYTALTHQMTDYCRSGHTALARGDYRALAKRFNTELSGLFPFGSASNPDAPLAVTKRFFLDYAAQRGQLRKNLDGTGTRLQRVTNFLDRLDAAADFLQSSLAAGPQSQPLGLEISFRYLPQASDPTIGGGSQLIGWRFETSKAEASYPNGNTVLNWQFGDPVALHLRWAGLSSYRPEADEAQTHLDVNAREASFSASGPWSLLRLIAAHRDTEPGVADPLNDRRVITAFSIPLKFIQPPGATKTHKAKLRLALDLVANDPSGKPGAQLSLPTEFPSKAPYLW